MIDIIKQEVYEDSMEVIKTGEGKIQMIKHADPRFLLLSKFISPFFSV
jgi:hypothetical protein